LLATWTTVKGIPAAKTEGNSEKGIMGYMKPKVVMASYSRVTAIPDTPKTYMDQGEVDLRFLSTFLSEPPTKPAMDIPTT